MADEIQITPDQFEIDLKKEVEVEQSKVAAADNYYKARRSQLLTQMGQEFFGTDKSFSIKLEAWNEEVILLNQATIWAKDKKPEALSAGYQLYALSAYTERVNLDKVMSGWLDSLKSKRQEQAEDFIFGKEKPPKIATARENQKIFESQDWPSIIRVYVEEALWRENIIKSAEDQLLALSGAYLKESFFPSQPDKIHLEQLERRLTTYQNRLSYHREFITGISQGRWNKEEIEEKARELALEDLKNAEEEKRQSQTKGEIERVPVPVGRSEIAKTRTATRGLTQVQLDERARIERRAELNAGNFSAREMIRYPSILVNKVSGFVKDYFRNLFGKKETAKKAVVKKVGEEAAKKTAGTVIKAGLKGLVTKLGLGAISGGVLTAVMFAKDLLTSKRLQEWAKNAFTFGLIYLKGLLTLLASNLIAGASAVIGGIAGLILGAKIGATIGLVIGGPLGGVLGGILGGTGGFIIGNVLGWQVGSVASGIFSGIGAGSTTTTVAATTTASTVGVNVGTMATGTGIASVGFWSVIVGPATVFTASIFSLIALFAVGAIQGQEVSGGPKISFSVKSEVDKKVLPNDSNSAVKYRVIITSQSDEDIEISAVVKETLQNAHNTNLISPQNIDSYPAKITPGEKIVINYQDYMVKDTFNDSDLVFIVTVASGAETETASSITRIGSPPVNNDRPFGYPSGGRISRFEDNPDHRGTFFNSSGSRYWATGGIDIVNVGGTPVYSTVKGPVIYSGFDYGKSIYSEKNCVSPISVVSPFNYCAVGGAVIVQSGNYIVSFLHLRQIGLATGTVAKGQIIGYMYDNPLPTSDTSHLHYQVLLNGANVLFGGEANDSSAPCTPEKILPEIVTRKTISQDGSGPFTCE